MPFPPVPRPARAPFAAFAALVSVSCRAAGPPAAGTAAGDAPPALGAVREADLRRDVYALASDAMRGREAGTPDELRAAAWVAERAREAGLEPAGDDGTYFQWWPMRRLRVSDASRAALGGEPLALGRDAVVASPPVAADVDLPLVWVGVAGPDSLRRLDLRGRAAAALVTRPASPPVSWISLRPWRYARLALAERAAALRAAGAAAAVLVADDSTDGAFATVAAQLRRGTYGVDTAGSDRVAPAAAAPWPATVWVPAALGARVRAAAAAGARLRLEVRPESFVVPSANVVARVPGRDPALRGEYVLFSGHHDHDGVRGPVSMGDDRRRGVVDSVWHGADDNATVSAALLAAGRAFARRPGRRSALFVWHGAEERGLLGSRWHAARPTVPRGAIAAVLNADMIGRNAPDSAALLGAQPPHRNSADLVGMALAANARVSRFALDTVWDRPSHPEGWYFRSDHLPYARAGVPAVMFSKLLHADYHTPADRAERVDYAKLTRVTRWMYATGWAVAEADRRPAVDPGFRLER